jgi:hypothetical protein
MAQVHERSLQLQHYEEFNEEINTYFLLYFIL